MATTAASNGLIASRCVERIAPWRSETPLIVEAPGLGSVKRWLSETGGGSLADCARFTGYDEPLCRQLLGRLQAEGTVATRRRLAWPSRQRA